MNETILEQLRMIVGDEHASSTEADRTLHSHGQSSHPAVLPDFVVWPNSTEEVSAIVKIAAKYKIAVTAWGAGTSLEGHVIPLKKGISLNFQRMNRVVEMYAEDFQVTVQPGIFRKELEAHLSRYGLMFAPDPGANATVGGMIANNAAGIRTVKYGATKDNVLALEIVLANGDIVKTGSRSVKQSAGYDLTHLIIGSEGTLALVTQATLKLVPIPEHFSTATVAFPSVEAAAEAVYGIIGSGLEPAALEMVHRDNIQWMNEDAGLDMVVAPSIMMEFSGASEVAVTEAIHMAQEICTDAGSLGFSGGIGRDVRKTMWELRHSIRERNVRTFPGDDWVLVDIAVPISKFPELVAYCQERIDEYGFDARILGHAGDGNMHSGIHYNPNDDVAKGKAVELGHVMVDRALELGGTCTGEHGIGIGKQKYLLKEHGENALEMMRLIKQTLDPDNLLNPGKVIPL
ncbi:MAG: D-lactate dehydrogenase (cytochrome) [Cellvibrionaceae bacterium]|jgi:D-lactate dehydrogenase (cytochrome)